MTFYRILAATIFALGAVTAANASISSRPNDKQHAHAQQASMTERCTNLEMHNALNHYADYFHVERSLVYALIFQESRCNNFAVSKAGAVGLMQLVPKDGAREAYQWIVGVNAKKIAITRKDLHDTNTNIMLGTAYLRILLDRFDYVQEGEPRLRFVLAAYNWGPNRVTAHMPDLTAGDPVFISRVWSNRIPVSETRGYVASVIKYKNYLDSLSQGS